MSVVPSAITKTTLAYLAGLIDGDGSIGIARTTSGNTRYKPYITICSTDPDVLFWVKKNCGGHITKYEPPAGRVQYRIWWTFRQAAVVSGMIQPYLILKKRHATLLSTWYSSGGKPSGGNWRWHPEEVRLRQDALYGQILNLNRLSRKSLLRGTRR